MIRLLYILSSIILVTTLAELLLFLNLRSKKKEMEAETNETEVMVTDTAAEIMAMQNDRLLKKLLTTKYGKPTSCTEKFVSAFGLKPIEDQQKLFAVSKGSCKYKTRMAAYATDNSQRVLKSIVALTYKDKINAQEIKEHAIDDL